MLDWLSLGSEGQWTLNQRGLAYDSVRRGFFPFVLTDQGIDSKFYDFINSYLVEPESNRVARVAGTNMNCRFITSSRRQARLPLRQGRPSERIIQAGEAVGRADGLSAVVGIGLPG